LLSLLDRLLSGHNQLAVGLHALILSGLSTLAHGFANLTGQTTHTAIAENFLGQNSLLM
jgi:hypothetical protein